MALVADSLLRRLRSVSSVILMGLLTVFPAFSQTQLLDEFETLAGWEPIASEGANGRLTSSVGKSGNAMGIEFELTGGYGYVIAQKEFAIELPENYQFTFDIRAEAPVNNFEFKLLDASENVWWIKKQYFEYPTTWTRMRIKKRHITFAWGPAGGGEIRRVAKIEFVVSTATGGIGKIWIDNFRFEPIVEPSRDAAPASLEFSSAARGSRPVIDAAGTMLTDWRSAGNQESEWLLIRFNQNREIGGLVLDWDADDFASDYSVEISDDGQEWFSVYSVVAGNGGRDYIATPETEGRLLRILFKKSSRNADYGIKRMQIMGPAYSASPNDFYSAVAKETTPGYYPKYFLKKQSYWTVIGADRDGKEALINQQGLVEVDRFRFSIEPFLFFDRKLVTWHDVTSSQSLDSDYLPIPSVTWNYSDRLGLTITSFAGGESGSSILYLAYRIENKTDSHQPGNLFLAIRPFQVNPPSQWLNAVGGVSRIDSIAYVRGVAAIDEKTVYPLTTPTGFGAASFDQGDISEYISRGELPAQQVAADRSHRASAAFSFDFDLKPGASRDVIVAVPFHNASANLPSNVSDQEASRFYDERYSETKSYWEEKLNTVSIKLPQDAAWLVNTVKSNLAYILINRDGAGIQPGSRSYERSWIRDGSLTSTAMLQMGRNEEVREFIDWYAAYQFPSGKIPCVVDARGADPMPENDSHGQYIYAVMQYFRFSGDTLWLRGKWDSVVKTVRYIQSLRALRKTEEYKNGSPEKRALYGLVPESISHEGYSAKPMHSYWDDFFTLRGLKDAAEMARALGHAELAQEFAAERDDFRNDFYNSMRLAMANTGVDYIPGCAELGDFDATSTTVGVYPCGELGNIPEPQLHTTFDQYFQFSQERMQGRSTWDKYTPYEIRTVGTFIYLDQKERAHAMLDFFKNDRRPPKWNHWAEVVWQNPDTAEFIGDMPHTWVGSDFIRSVRSIFAYERERDASLVIGAGIPESWLGSAEGIEVAELPTYYGKLTLKMKRKDNTVFVELSGLSEMPTGGIVIKSPMTVPIKKVNVNSTSISVENTMEFTIRKLPANIAIHY
ncbi:MAG: discoidin domain-containing protein [Candidatus Zhuqueibacterota bacterium]